MVFWRPGEPRQTNHTFLGRYCLFGLAAEGGKANKPFSSRKCVVVLHRCPRPPKKHLAKKPLRDPFEEAEHTDKFADKKRKRTKDAYEELKRSRVDGPDGAGGGAGGPDGAGCGAGSSDVVAIGG